MATTLGDTAAAVTDQLGEEASACTTGAAEVVALDPGLRRRGGRVVNARDGIRSGAGQGRREDGDGDQLDQSARFGRLSGLYAGLGQHSGARLSRSLWIHRREWRERRLRLRLVVPERRSLLRRTLGWLWGLWELGGLWRRLLRHRDLLGG